MTGFLARFSTRFLTRFLRRNASRIAATTLMLASALLCSALLQAEDDSPGATARLSSAEGGIRLVQAGQVVADPAPANAPLFEGAQLLTAEDGKAEIQFEDGSIARLSPNSALTLASIGRQAPVEVSFDSGLGYFEVAGSNRQMRIRFGDAVLTASSGAIVRLRFDTPPGEVAVLAGTAHLEQGKDLALDLTAGQTVTLDANGAGRYGLDDRITPDSWDVWNQDRDQALNAAASNLTTRDADIAGDAYTNPAWNDLDANGDWYDVPGQGYVWSPFAAANGNWDPYGCGHWMWTPRWGYVWASCEHWGFMPYMCGAWSYYDSFGWGWAPGMGMGCRGGSWGAGYFGGVHVANAPGWYKLLYRPSPKRPIGRTPVPILVNRRDAGSPGGKLPPRNGVATFGGQQIRPIGRIAIHPMSARVQEGFSQRTSPTEPLETLHAPGMVYGVHPTPGSAGMFQRPGNNVRTVQPMPGAFGSTQPSHGFYQPQQQPHSFQPQQQQRNFQPAPQQHSFQPAPQHYQAPAPSFHMSAPSAPAPAMHSAPSPPPANAGGHR